MTSKAALRRPRIRAREPVPTIVGSQGAWPMSDVLMGTKKPHRRLRWRGWVSAPGRTRTCGQALRRRLLYPLSYGGRLVAAATGALGSVTLPGTRIGLLSP